MCCCVISRPSGPSKALKLGAKGKEIDNFVDKLKSEGENIIVPSAGKKASEVSKVLQPPVNTERYVIFPNNNYMVSCKSFESIVWLMHYSWTSVYI